MKQVIGLILLVGAISIVVLLCFFSCIISSRTDGYWEKVKKEMEKRDERH